MVNSDNELKEATNGFDFWSLEEIYREIKNNGRLTGQAHLLLTLRDWLIIISEFDIRSGQPLPMGLSQLLQKISEIRSRKEHLIYADRLSRIAQHSSAAIQAIVNNTRQNITREHKMMPLHAVREMDTKSFQWISRKPGRNIREKLKGKPYIKAVSRRMSIDTTENRLFKDFVRKLELQLLDRSDARVLNANDDETELLAKLQKWQRTAEAGQVGDWMNVPPNNTLLQERNYRSIWDAWIWLQRLDEDIQTDVGRLSRDWKSVLFWQIIWELKYAYGVRFIELPVLTNYDEFEIIPQVEMQGLLYSSHPTTSQLGIYCQQNSSDICFSTIDKQLRIITKMNKKTGKRTVHYGDKFHELGVSIDDLVQCAQNIAGDLLAGHATPSKYHKSIDSPLSRYSADAVIDLCSIRPQYAVENIVGNTPFRLIRQSWHAKDQNSLSLDLGTSEAIAFRPETQTLSMLNMFTPQNQTSNGILSEASMAFSKRLSTYFAPERLLTYLVPDLVDDFSLTNIRSSVNYFFPKARPLPRSVAAVYTWIKSMGEGSISFNKGDCILVMDSILDKPSITPLICCSEKTDNLANLVPETGGFYWERYPAFEVMGISPSKEIIQILEQDDCQVADQIVRLFGLGGVLGEKNSFSVLDKNNLWYTPPSSISPKSTSSIEWRNLSGHVPDLGKNSIFLLPLDKYSTDLEIQGIPKNLIKVSIPSPLVTGAQYLSELQSRARDIPLWLDHLPELSIEIIRDGYYDLLYLVKDKVVEPRWGRKQKIDINENFTIPENAEKLSFPLYLGGGAKGKQLEYNAVVKSKILPLKAPVDVKLELYYNYGAENIYELRFKPLNKSDSPFSSLTVQWEASKEVVSGNHESDQPFPGYPKIKRWEEFKNYFNPYQAEKGHTDLLEWLEDMAENYCQPRRDQRSRFDNIYKDIEEKSWKSVSFSTNKMRGAFEVTTRNLWSQGRSIQDADCPPALIKFIPKLISSWMDLSGIQLDRLDLESHLASRSMVQLRRESLMLLSRFHADLPDIVIEYLTELIISATQKEGHISFFNLRSYIENASMVLGEVNSDSQKKLFSVLTELFNLNDKKITPLILRALSVASWRNEAFIFSFTSDSLVKTMIALIEDDLASSVSHPPSLDRDNNGQAFKDLKGPQKEYIINLQHNLELLLAIIRLWKLSDSRTSWFDPAKPQTKRIAFLVRRIDALLKKAGQGLGSRVQFSFKNQRDTQTVNMSDLAYTINSFLTLEDGSQNISISGIIEDEQE